MADALDLWTVYRRPCDIPDAEFVARRYTIEPGRRTLADLEYLVAETIDELRAKLPPGLVRLDPMPGDDPVIVEVWL